MSFHPGNSSYPEMSWPARNYKRLCAGTKDMTDRYKRLPSTPANLAEMKQAEVNSEAHPLPLAPRRPQPLPTGETEEPLTIPATGAQTDYNCELSSKRAPRPLRVGH
jgi:hypothetical protein